MPITDVLVTSVREVAIRSLRIGARQEATSDGGTAVTSSTPSATAIEMDNGNSQDQKTSPLLFFVALGFGVVFTNLWIIVGVKYCFRYNARSRQLRMAEEGDPVALENIPRPHRRRREKKLMTMDEVNEKFPMLKYKSWVSARAREGLPTMGGVSAPPSRANSIRSVERISPELGSKERSSDDQRPTTSASMTHKLDEVATADTMTHVVTANNEARTEAKNLPANGQTSRNTIEVERANLQRVESDDDNDDEHIDSALPPECMGTSGDSCAICIELIEDDDDVRGLTCGHAFHAVCIDPWLTSRRACCPLCKADYYTPKPRQTDVHGNPLDQSTFSEMGRTTTRLNMPSSPPTAWYSFSGQGRWFLSAGLRSEVHHQTSRTANRRRTAPTRTRPQIRPVTNQVSENEGRRTGNMFSNFTSSLPRFRLPQLSQLRRNNGTDTSVANVGATPSQLEAGNRPAAVV